MAEFNDPYYIEPSFEDEDENVSIDDPFNPEDISIDTKSLGMEACLRRIQQKTIILNPDFRREEVWTIDKKSRLIESLMLKIPLPMFYVSADEKNVFTVVDGLQRLSTIRSFILGDEYLKTENPSLKGEGFKLKSLEFWTKYDGKTFNDLPINLQHRLLEAEFTFTIINPGTPENVKRNIFKRINTGGPPLSTQEIRNVLYTGRSTELLNQLAESKEFKSATGNSVKSSRMEDRELVLRLLAFLIRKPVSYPKNNSMDTFLSDTMRLMNAFPALESRDVHKLFQSGTLTPESVCYTELEQLLSLFNEAMHRATVLFGSHAFRRSYNGKRRTPINKALFEMWGVLLSQLSRKEFDRLYLSKDLFMNQYIKLLEDNDFQNLISRDSLKVQSVQRRFQLLSELLNQYTK